tara:strand:- start:83 stop:520 length:438 start_codon:yes stop_codon:yes gene_type:complete
MVEITEASGMHNGALTEQKLDNWLNDLCRQYNKELAEVNIVLLNDEDLLKKNIEILDHDTYTDIITQDYVVDDLIIGDLFISIDRIIENAEKHKVSFSNELHRVIAHGVLHLIGYKDKSEEEALVMSEQEAKALELYSNLFHVEL